MRLLRESQRIHSLVEVVLPLFAATALAQGDGSPSAAAHDAATLTVQPSCESRTVNYITHTLPQQCLTSTSTAATATTTIAEAGSVTVSQATEPTAQRNNESDGADFDGDGNDLSTGGFMSFEEWKEMMLKKSGGDPIETRSRKAQDREAYPGGDFDTLGEEGEISLDFDVYSDRISEITSSNKPSPRDREKAEDSVEKVQYEEGLAPMYRSKDAGKTCKERFSYASFDAGATILKTSPGAKNPKAILTEYKDSYMLLECAMKNKFFIVELSDDILVDTVVLANFEFFSSMVRQFRVSVSDRFPVKLEKWKVLGEFTARNSRDIQPFLVENPQIWARYLRIEILSHYGNEYYCPLSLLRVHGTRMLDSLREVDPSELEGETSAEEEAAKSLSEEGEEVEPAGEPAKEAEVAELVPLENLTVQVQMGQSDVIAYWDQSYFIYTFQAESTCSTGESPVQPSHTLSDGWVDDNAAPARPQPVGTAQQTSQATSSASPSEATRQAEAANSQPTQAVSTSSTSSSPNTGEAAAVSSSPAPEQSNAQQASNAAMKRSSSIKNKTAAATSLKPPSSKASQQSKPPSNSPTPPRNNKTSTSTLTAAASSPTVQDSFFKQLTKRLQTLESNTTLSLQYIEMQSKFLQEALLKLERRQLQKVDLFLDTLNKTVLSELRHVRSQYDQIWQSTVIALETQREQSEREIVALSSRLGVLADEVVFQKRMAIVQSVLLLGCLVLVIFSKGLVNASGLEVYYPSQFLAGVAGGSGSRLNSPVFQPATPIPPRERDPGLIKRAKRSTASLRESIEEVEEETHSPAPPPPPTDLDGINPSLSSTPEAPTIISSPHHQNIATHQTHTPILSGTESLSKPRPLPAPRAVSEAAGLEYYQTPTPASMDIGYDSEPADSSSGADYFPSSTSVNGDEHGHGHSHGGRGDDDDVVIESTTYSEIFTRKALSDRQLTPSSEGGAMEYSGSGLHRAPRPPISHSSSTRNANALPALPEDPD